MRISWGDVSRVAMALRVGDCLIYAHELHHRTACAMQLGQTSNQHLIWRKCVDFTISTKSSIQINSNVALLLWGYHGALSWYSPSASHMV